MFTYESFRRSSKFNKSIDCWGFLQHSTLSTPLLDFCMLLAAGKGIRGDEGREKGGDWKRVRAT